MCPPPPLPEPVLQAAPTPSTAGGCLDAFLQVQVARAEAYGTFDAAFKQHLATGAEGPYRAVMGQLTGRFQLLSQQSRTLEAALRAWPDQAAADAVLAIQGWEREKLRLTMTLQALRASVAQQRFSWQHEGHAGQGCCGAPAEEPTEAEVAGATREAYRDLEECILSINESMMELQQAREDLSEGAPPLLQV